MTVYSLLLVEATTEAENGGKIKVAVVEKIESKYDSTTRGPLI